MVRQVESPWTATKQDIHAAINRNLDASRDAALVTVVAVEGSGYRRPGAKMIVGGDGKTRGAVTAGCLEGPVTELAHETIDRAAPQTETYDLTDNETDAWGLGLGCNGIIDVFVEPIDESFAPIINKLEERQSVTAFTAVCSADPGVNVGDRTVMAKGRRKAVGRDALSSDVIRMAMDRAGSLSTDESGCVTVETADGDVRVFVDRIEPAPELLLFGGQEDINPVASLAAQAGFHVRVATARGGHADPERYPAADEVVATHPSDLADLVMAPDYTYAVVMSHNLIDDRIALDALLDTDIQYIGLMGPRKRFRELREEIDLKGRNPERIATPVGLDLGGDEPISIGFSIVSELLTVHNDCSGERLTNQNGSIHDRSGI